MPEALLMERGAAGLGSGGGQKRMDVVPPACPDCSTFETSQQAIAHIGQEAFELAAYRDEPPQMKSGTRGKAGYLRLAFHYDQKLERTVLTDLDRRAPLLAQKALYWEESQPDMACVIVIATTGCIVQGDRLVLDVSAEADAKVLVTTQCASKVHCMAHNYASQLQNFQLGEGSYVEYMPDPLILHRTARYLQDTNVLLPASASFVFGDVLVPGRRWHHEEELFGFDLYSAGIRVMRPGASMPLFEERLVLDPTDVNFRNIGVMGGYEILGSLYALMPERHIPSLKRAIGAAVEKDLAWGASVLPSGAGLALRVLGNRSEEVRAKMREFHSMVRHALLGRPLPAEFLWR